MEFGNMAIGENAPGRRLGTWPTSKQASLHALKHRGRFARQNPSPHPSVMVHVHGFFKVCLAVGCLSRNLAGTLDILLVDCLQKITPKFIF